MPFQHHNYDEKMVTKDDLELEESQIDPETKEASFDVLQTRFILIC
jgi:hypothetical protein